MEPIGLMKHMNEIIDHIFVGTLEDAVQTASTYPDWIILCVLEQRPANEPACAIHVPLLEISPDGPVINQIRLEIACDIIDNAYTNGYNILVHCQMGIERSPLTVAYWLATRQYISLDNAYKILKLQRPVVEDRRSWLPENLRSMA